MIQKLLWVFVCHSLSWDSMSFCSIIPLSHSLWGKADKCAAEADVKGIRRINFTTMTIISLTYGALAFLCTYVAQQPMADFVNALPAVITHGLEVAGGILPAVGFAMLLRVMMKVKYTPYFIAGFLMACFCEMPNLLPGSAAWYRICTD